MLNKVVGMSARPSKVEPVIDIGLPKPCAREQDIIQIYHSKILDILNLSGDIGMIGYQI